MSVYATCEGYAKRTKLGGGRVPFVFTRAGTNVRIMLENEEGRIVAYIMLPGKVFEGGFITFADVSLDTLHLLWSNGFAKGGTRAPMVFVSGREDYDGIQCLCPKECPGACKGGCGCPACHAAYSDFLSCQGG